MVDVVTKTQVDKMKDVGEGLKTLRQPYEHHLREIGEYFMPRRNRFYKARSHRARDTINHKLINPRPRLALRTSQSGMHTGMTSPARPWFRLITVDPKQREDAMIKAHLEQSQRAMRQLLQSSGTYQVLHSLWGDLLWSGSDAMIMEDDLDEALRPLALVPGEYWLGTNSSNLVDTLYREVSMPLQYIVGKFVYAGNKYGAPDWSVVPNRIKEAWDKGMYGETFEVCHLIAPRHDRDKRSWMPKDKPVMSRYWLKDDDRGSGSRLLGDLGYDHSPIIASRWEVEGTNVYGSSPAMDALPDAKTLQIQEKDKREAIRRMNRPPMNADLSLRNSGYSLMPEAVNFMADPTKGLMPAFQVTPPLAHLQDEIDRTEDRLDEAMYSNLFLMISQLDRREITAREIDERHEEKLLGLGPVLERQHREKLGPLIQIAHRAAIKTGMVEPLPSEYNEVNMEIDYISMLAQAQKAVATNGMERFYGFLGNVSAADEGVLDMADNDRAITLYADMLSIPGDVLRPKSEVEALRQRRAEAAQQQMEVDQAQQMAPAMKQSAEAAKVLSETDANNAPRGDVLRQLGLR